MAAQATAQSKKFQGGKVYSNGKKYGKKQYFTVYFNRDLDNGARTFQRETAAEFQYDGEDFSWKHSAPRDIIEVAESIAKELYG